ncbi:MAG: hypothetical protein AAF399_13775 [Bacteroidota bacterium]
MNHANANKPRQLTIFLAEAGSPPRTYLVYFETGRLRFLDSGKPVNIPATATALLSPLEASMQWMPNQRLPTS